MTDDLVLLLEHANLINRGMCPDCDGVGSDENAHFYCSACQGEGIRVIPTEEFERRVDDGTLGWCQERDSLEIADFVTAMKLFFAVPT